MRFCLWVFLLTSDSLSDVIVGRRALDVHKTSDAYMIEIDLPGILPETDFIMQTDGNRLAIMVERLILCR